MAELQARETVTQTLPPRFALVVDHKDASSLQRSDVLGVYEERFDGPRDTLTVAENAFVSAWESRRRPKERLGEGLSWDSPGFLPPDPPKRP